MKPTPDAVATRLVNRSAAKTDHSDDGRGPSANSKQRGKSSKHGRDASPGNSCGHRVRETHV